MTRPFAAIERFFERLFERPAARLFHAPLQPVQLQRRLERMMDSGRVFSADRTYVPNRYRVALNPEDLRTFETYSSTLETDLAEALHARARARGYRLLARPQVRLIPADEVAPGDIDVSADLLDASLLDAAAHRGEAIGRPIAPAEPVPGMVPAAPVPGMVHPGQFPQVASAGAGTMAAVGSAVGPLPPQDFGSIDPAVSGVTAVYPAPRPRPLMALVEVRPFGGPVSAFTFTGATARVGRGVDNEIVLLDERVSRHHGQLTSRQGTLVYSDLGSTNGSFVNGTRVREIALGHGDVVRLGNSTLTIQPHP